MTPVLWSVFFKDTTIDHYSVLRTLDDFYGLPHVGRTESASPIISIWRLEPLRAIKKLLQPKDESGVGLRATNVATKAWIGGLPSTLLDRPNS